MAALGKKRGRKRKHHGDEYSAVQDTQIAKENTIEMTESEEETPIGDLEPFPDLLVESSQTSPIDVSAGLPEWLKKPIVLHSNEQIPFTNFSISSRLASRLKQKKLEYSFPVQAKVWELVKERGDLCICAPTGSGKTLSYGIPIIEALSSRSVPRIRCLIIVPTKELVIQIHKVLETFAGGSGLLIGTFGVKSFVAEQESLSGFYSNYFTLMSSLDIVVSTPGRLVSHIESSPGFSLQHLKYLVIDEADRLLNSRFHNWVEVVIPAIHSPPSQSPVSESFSTLFDDTILSFPRIPKCKKLIFSATQTRNLESLMALKLSSPRMIVSDVRMKDDDLLSYLPPTLHEKFYKVPIHEKPLHLLSLVQNQKSSLVFVKSTDTAARLHKLLAKCGLESGLYSSDNASRKPLISKFSGGLINVLVCTDLMARGVDLHVQQVFNYDLPRDIGQYVHRVGRTARAGKDGLALTLVEKGQENWVRKTIVNGIGRNNDVEWATCYIDESTRSVYEEALQLSLKLL